MPPLSAGSCHAVKGAPPSCFLDSLAVTSLASSSAVDVLLFELGTRSCGLPAAAVRELVRAVTIVPLPAAPAVVEGLVNVRGSIVPVLDVRSRFSLPPKPLEHTDCFVVAWAADRLVALRADRANGLLHLEAGQVDDAALAGPGVRHVAAVARMPDGLLLIYDLATFLSAAEASELDAALASAKGDPIG